VRHNHHGGLFAPLTRDLFLAPTRAPRELEMSLALTERGVPTPAVVAYAVYPGGGLFQRADVCSHEIANGRDLAQILSRSDPASRHGALEATAILVATLSVAGARHHDLNAKNVFVTGDGAHILDVDRVTLDVPPPRALEANLARLSRSLRKWRDEFGANVSEREVTQLEADARGAFRAA